jgi:hypothetical protein
MVCNMGVFSPVIIYNELEWFFTMGLPDYYLSRFSAEVMANHIHAFIASKKSAQTIGSPEDIWLHIENNPNFGAVMPDGEQCLMMIPNEPHKTLAAERKLEVLMSHVTAKPVSLEYTPLTASHSNT